MFRFNTKKVLMLFSVAILLTLPSQAEAQLSEGEMSRFLPPDTFLFLSINMESIMQQVDDDNEIVKEFRTREKFSAADFTETRQYLMVVATSKEENENQFDMPAAMITRYSDVIDKQVYLKKAIADGFGNFRYESESHANHEIYCATFDGQNGVRFAGDPPAFFFAAEDIVAVSNTRLIKEMIDNQDENSTAKELVGNRDSEAEIHLILDDGSNITRLPFFAFMEEGVAVPGVDIRELLESVERLEIIGDSDQMIPIKATIEMKSEKAAEDLEELIATGLQAAPGLLMMLESQLDERVAPIADVSKRLIALGKKAASELEVARDGATLAIQLDNIEGLDKLAESCIVLTAWQYSRGPGEVIEVGR